MSDIILVIQEFGPSVGLIAILMYWVFFLQKKLLSIIENNTSAITKAAEAANKNADALFEITNSVRDCPANTARRTS